MPAITPTDLTNAKTDVDKISEFMESTSATMTTRLGATVKTRAGMEAEFPNASGNAAAAAASAAEAEADKNAAQTAATDAASQAITAGGHASTAGAAAATATTGAKFGDTIAAGRALVTDGNTFGAKPNATDGLTRPKLYRREAAGGQTFLYSPASIEELNSDLAAATDTIVADTVASLPAGRRGQFALVVADRLNVTSTNRQRSNGIALLTFATAHGLSPGANVNIRGFGGAGYNRRTSLRAASGLTVDYPCPPGPVAAEASTADTGGYIDRNGIYQYNGNAWTWVADIGNSYPTRPAARVADRASSINRSMLQREVFDAYFAPTFQPQQRVLTINEAATLAVDSIVPNTPEGALVVYADNVLVNYGTKSGNSYSVNYTAPGAVDLDVDLLAVADTRRGTAKLAVAEAVRFSQDLTLWTKSNVTVTGGHPDPDGGNNAYRVLCNTNGTAVQHNVSVTASPAPSNPLGGEEVWIRADTTPYIAISDGAAASIAYMNLSTGEIQTQNVNCAIVERRGPWVKVWWQQRTGTVASACRLYVLTAFGAVSNTTAGTEAAFFYKPRQIDGVLPMFSRQRAAWRSGTNPAYATRYVARSDFMDSAATMNTDINLDVVVPDSYTPTKRYPVLYVREVEATPGGTYQDGLQQIKSLNIHNTYDCILVRNYHRGGDIPWDGVKNDGTLAHATFFEECVIPFIDSKYSTIRHREGRLLVGFSKSGFGAMSYLLRRPDLFGYACAWDVPWGLQFDGTDAYKLDAFGNPSVNAVGQDTAFGTQAQFQLYNPADILASKLASVNDKCRIVLGGAHAWNGDLPFFMNLLDTNGVQYLLHYTSPYDSGGFDNHNWIPPYAPAQWLQHMLPMMFGLR